MIKVESKKEKRICQGDIFKDIEHVEYALEEESNVEISKINFPLVIVLTQDCDLAQDYKYRIEEPSTNNQDKFLISVIVAPLYNVEHIYMGEHLSEIGLKMQNINKDKSPGQILRKNKNPRYHYLDFPKNIPIASSIIDFKHYFTVNVNYLLEHKSKKFICKVSELYREDISQRFASFLSRIGLPPFKK